MTDTPTVVAFMSWGRWVADCPNAACTNAMALERGQSLFRCHVPSGMGTCGAVAGIDWPAYADEVEQRMASRPPAEQSWKPEPKEEP